MNYIDLNIRTNDSEQSEIFIAQLSDWPFDSFDDQEGVLSRHRKRAGNYGERSFS